MMRTRSVIILLVFALFASAWAWQARYALRFRTLQYDFVAFYCGASVARDGGNPYTIEPLRTCEHTESTIFAPRSRLVVPAPLPPYAFALLRPLATLPFLLARLVWLALQLAAYAGLLALLIRLTGFSLATLTAATLFSVLYPSLTLGQVVPLVAFGLTLAAFGMERDRPWLVASGLLCASLEPHVAAPAFVGAALLSERARLPVLGVGIVLVALSIATAGVARNVDYLTNVLAAHALSEVNNQEQYGISSLAHSIGVSQSAAIAIGHVAFLIALACGTALAARLAATTKRAAFIILTPPAVALFASVFLHIQQFAVAVPFALLLAAISASRSARLAVATLAVPWGFFYSLVPAAPLASAAFAYLVERCSGFSRRSAIVGGLVALSALAEAEFLRPIDGRAFPWNRYASVPTSNLAEALWKPLIDFGFHSAPALYAATKIPTFAALAASVAAALVIVTSPSRRTTTRCEAIALDA